MLWSFSCRHQSAVRGKEFLYSEADKGYESTPEVEQGGAEPQ